MQPPPHDGAHGQESRTSAAHATHTSEAALQVPPTHSPARVVTMTAVPTSAVVADATEQPRTRAAPLPSYESELRYGDGHITNVNRPEWLTAEASGHSSSSSSTAPHDSRRGRSASDGDRHRGSNAHASSAHHGHRRRSSGAPESSAAPAPRLRRPSAGVPRLGRPFASDMEVFGTNTAVSPAVSVFHNVAHPPLQQQQQQQQQQHHRRGDVSSADYTRPGRSESRHSRHVHYRTGDRAHTAHTAHAAAAAAASQSSTSSSAPRSSTSDSRRHRSGHVDRARGHSGPSAVASSRASRPHSTAPSTHSGTESADTASTRVTRDSFGYVAYHPIFRLGGVFSEHDGFDTSAATRPRSSGPPHPSSRSAGHGSGGGGGGGPADLLVPTTTDVPWDLRNNADQEVAKSFAFLSSRYFWFLIEYALRVTLIAMLVPAALINASLPHSPFASTTFALAGVVIATGTNFGQASLFFVQYTKAGAIWLPLSTICVALKLNHHLGAWFVVYVVVLFLMAVFTEKTTRRMCLLLYNICMVSLLSGDESLVFPSRVLADWALGAAFALVATLLPYPLLATRLSARITRTMFNNTATCFTGILSCFWAPSNTERSMSMVRVRFLLRTLDHLIDKFDAYDAFTFYEVLIYETSERREVRKEKVKLLLKLKMNLRTMERVINMVQERPQMMDQSERCLLLRDHLSVPMDNISRSVEALLWSLSSAKKYDELKAVGDYFEATGRAIKHLQNEFAVGRRVLFYEHQGTSTTTPEGRMEEFVPLMTFFVFSIVNFWTTLAEFEAFIDRHKATNDWKQTIQLVWNAVLEPFAENVELVRLLCVRRAEPELRTVLEAAKVSVAMLISVVFFYFVDNQSLLLSGPTIIAFVSGTNPVEAVQAGAARMSGTLIGSVLGFFAASLCKTAADRVASLCVITFVMTFFRPGQKFGTICMYCNFVAVSSLAPTEQTAEMTISRIQQNTFAIFIYCFISVSVFPVSPNHVLFKKRVAVMHSLNSTVQKLTALFNDAAHSYVELRAAVRCGTKTEDDIVTITTTAATPRWGGGLDSSPANNHNKINDTVRLSDMPDALSGNRFSMNEPLRRSMAMNAAFAMAPEDTIVETIFVDIFATLEVMKSTASVMPLAADEFQIIPREYPLRASGDVHAALYRLCALVYTMTCSWKTMREKGYFTSAMLHILHNLAPVTNDIGRCLDRFIHVMEFYIRVPSSGLSSELTKGAMQFRALCVELSARKERDLIAVIRQTIMEKRIRDSDAEDQHDDDAGGGGGGGGGGSGGGGGEGGGGGGSMSGSGGDRRPRRSRTAPSSKNGSGTRHPGQSSDRRRHHSRRSPRHHSSGGGRRRGRSRASSKHRHGNHRQSGRSSASASSLRAHRQHTHRGRDVLHATPSSLSAPEPPSHITLPGSSTNNAGIVTPLFDASIGYRGNMAGATGMHSRPDAQTPASPHPTATGSHAGSSRLADTVATTHNHSTTANAVDAGAAAANSEWPPPPAQSERSASPNSVGARPRPRRHGSPFDDADSAATAAPAAHEEERLRAATATMSNDTRIFDPSAFPPPPADEEAVVAGTARQHTHHGLTGTLEPHRREGGATPALPSRDSNDPSYSDHHHHHNHHRGTSRSSHHSAGRRQQQQQQHAPRLVAHEESLAVRKPSALTRVERLRENLRGLQRQASSAVLQRRHSSAEMRAFGASYANLAGLASSAGATQHATTAGSGTNGGAYQHQPHHHSGRAHHHRHDSRPQRHRSPGQSRSTTFYGDGEGGDMEHSRHDMRRRHAERGRDSSAPYGSQNDDTALLEASASALGHAPHRREDAALTPLGAPGGNARDSWQDAPTRHYSADRVTLDQTSSDEDADRNRRHHTRHDGSASRSSSASSPSRSSSSSDYSQRSDSVLSSTASLVRFNDSFTTPITVHDAEGLHSFTLALEMFSRELRRVLYGFEEMVQSL